MTGYIPCKEVPNGPWVADHHVHSPELEHLNTFAVAMLKESQMMYDKPNVKRGNVPKEPLSEYTLDLIETLAKRIKASALNHKEDAQERVDELSECATNLTIQLIEARAGLKQMEDLYRKDHGMVKDAVAELRYHQAKLEQELKRQNQLTKELTASRFDYMTAVAEYRVKKVESERKAQEAEDLRFGYHSGMNELALLKESQQKELLMMATQLWSLKSLSADVVSDVVWTLRDGMEIAQEEINQTINGLDKMIKESLESPYTYPKIDTNGNAQTSEDSGYSSGTKFQSNGLTCRKPRYTTRCPTTPPGLQSRRNVLADLKNIASGSWALPQDPCPLTSELHGATHPQADVLNLFEKKYEKTEATIERHASTKFKLDNDAFYSCNFDDLGKERASYPKQFQSTGQKYNSNTLRDAVRESPSKKVWPSTHSPDRSFNSFGSFEDHLSTILNSGDVPIERMGRSSSVDSDPSCGIYRSDSDWIDRPDLMDDFRALLEGELLEKVGSSHTSSRQDKTGTKSEKDGSGINQESGTTGARIEPDTPIRDVDQQNSLTSRMEKKFGEGCYRKTVDEVLPQAPETAVNIGYHADPEFPQRLRNYFQWSERKGERVIASGDQDHVKREDPSVKKMDRKKKRETHNIKAEKRLKEKRKMKMAEHFDYPFKALHLTEKNLQDEKARKNGKLIGQETISASLVPAQVSWSALYAGSTRHADVLLETEPPDFHFGMSEQDKFKAFGSVVNEREHPEG